jgi:WhiB family redox-sensing transcriptional regulator
MATDFAFSYESWMDAGACRSEDPDLFFPVSAQGDGKLQTLQALTVCRRCPVQRECLRYAVTNRQRHGVWGGTTEEERLTLFRHRVTVPPRYAEHPAR